MTYTNKTKQTTITPETYIKDTYKGKEAVQSEMLALIDLYTKVTGSPCVIWNKIFGFGKYHYQDSKGGAHEYLTTGFAVSASGFTLYNMMGWDNYRDQIEKLGKYKLSGKSCLAIKHLADIDQTVLKLVIKKSVADMKQKYQCIV